MVDQKIRGKNNTSAIYNINETNIILKTGDNETSVSLSQLWDILINNLLDQKDAEINKSLQYILINKTNNEEKYDSSKIIRSLISIGVPLPCAIEIAKTTSDEVIQWSKTNRNEEKLTTKHIRSIVIEVMRELDANLYPRDKIESWSSRYIRKYGRNNRNIEIYEIPTAVYKDGVVGISYEFLKSSFIPDVFNEIAPNKDFTKEITSSALDSMAGEIIEFVNGCDLYRIRYSVLKNVIIEIATQPPHPWLIDNLKREELIAYDKEAVESNLRRAKQKLLEGTAVPYEVITEILHHASSMILGHYSTFLGNEDISSFVQLMNYLKSICKPEESKDWDLILSDYIFRGLHDDFSLANVNMNSYLDLMCKIYHLYSERHNYNHDFMQALFDFAEQSINIVTFGNYDLLQKFLESDWAIYNRTVRNNNIRTLLRLLFPLKKKTETSTGNSHFWMKYVTFGTPSVDKRKPNVFVIVEDATGFSFPALGALNHQNARQTCDTILFIGQHFTNKRKLLSQIENELKKQNLSDFLVITLDKDDFANLLTSKNRVETLDAIIQDQTLYDSEE